MYVHEHAHVCIWHYAGVFEGDVHIAYMYLLSCWLSGTPFLTMKSTKVQNPWRYKLSQMQHALEIPHARIYVDRSQKVHARTAISRCSHALL